MNENVFMIMVTVDGEEIIRKYQLKKYADLSATRGERIKK